MTPREINDAKARAEAVLNGFKTANMQCARDAKRLAETLLVRDRQIENLRETIEEMEKRQTNPLGNIFRF